MYILPLNILKPDGDRPAAISLVHALDDDRFATEIAIEHHAENTVWGAFRIRAAGSKIPVTHWADNPVKYSLLYGQTERSLTETQG